MAADAENAALVAQINRINITKSAYEKRKLAADAQNSEFQAKINQFEIEISKIDAKSTAIGADISKELNECNNDPHGVASCMMERNDRIIWGRR